MNWKEKLETYIESVENCSFPSGVWQKKAIKRYQSDLTRDDIYIDELEAVKWCSFFSILSHSKGKQHAGKRFILEGWQVFLIWNVYGWKRKSDGLRRFKSVYIEIARKNGKSTLVTGMALGAMLIDKEQTPEVYSAATKSDQARIIFDEAKRMVQKSASLNKKLKTSRDAIVNYSNFGTFKPLSSDGKTLDGLNVHFAAIDEVHAHKNSEVIDLLDTATGAREQPLIVEITTAGSNKGTICYKHHELTRKILDGIIEQDSWFGVIYSIDEGDDWQVKENWVKANPNLRVSKRLEYMAEQYDKARNLPSFLNTFLRLDLNVWTGSETRWITDEKWQSCKDLYTESDLIGLECYGGLDLASVGDTNAFSLVFRCEDGKVRMLNYFWIPEETKHGKYELSNIDYPEWVKNGHMIQTNKPSRDDDAIFDKIVELSEKFNIKGIAMDRWQSTQIATKLEEVGIEIFEFGQGFKSMSEPTKKLEQLVINGELKHNGNKCMRWMMSNVMLDRDAADNIKINKAKSTDKVDGPVSLVMALGILMQREHENNNSNYVW